MTDCPSDTDLSGFLDESLPPELAAGLSAHVDGCTRCQIRLDRLTHDADGTIARYQELSSILPSGPGAVVSSPEAGTLILGGDPPLPAPELRGLPLVPGFDVAAEIGRGGMGVVYRARHRGLNRLCALKMVLSGSAADTVTIQRFLFEAEILARVQHPQVVQVFEVDTYQGPSGVPIPYLAMELLEGGSLGARIREGPMPPREAAEMMEGVARAVHAAHIQGVIHRDLKPGNILFPKTVDPQPAGAGSSPSNSTTRTPNSAFLPKVTDFGLAKFIETGAGMTQSGQVVGTPHYMAPEQASGGKRVGPAADVYALGAMLFECLAGRRPFEGDEPMNVLLRVVNEPAPALSSVRPDVPRDLAAVVARCLDKDPRRRYPSAADFADDLHRFLENRPTIARPLKRRERLWLWAKRNPAVAGLASALGGVLLVAFVLVTWFWLRAEATAEKERDAKDIAQWAERAAIRSAEEAHAAKNLAARRQAELEFSRGMNTCEEGRVEEGLRLFVRALELAEQTNATDLAHVIRVNLAAWPAELPPGRRAFPHKAQPRMAAFLPDGAHMVTAGREGEVHLWEVASGRKVRTYRSPGFLGTPILDLQLGSVYWCVAVSPDGKTIAAGGGSGRVVLWNTDAPDRWSSFDAVGEGQNVWMMEFAPDGSLWTNDGGAGLKRWNLAARPVPVATRFSLGAGTATDVLQALTLSPDGKRVYSGDRAGTVREWDAQTGRQLRAWFINGWVSDIALSADGSRVAATGPEGVARVFHLNESRPPTEISLGGAYGNGIAFAPKRPFVLTSDADGNVRAWHQDTGQPIGVPYRFSGEVTKIRFRKGSDEFAVPAGNTVFVARAPDPPVEVLSAGSGLRVRGLDFSAAGDRLAATDDNNLQVFDPLSGKRVQWVAYTVRLYDRLVRVIDSPLTLRFDPDPARAQVFRGVRNGFDRIAVPGGWSAQRVPTRLLNRVKQIAFVGGGKGLIAMDEYGLARFDATSLRSPRRARPAPDIPAGVDLRVLAARPDGGEVLVAFANRVAFLDPDTLAPVRKEWRTRDEALDACYTPDGKKVLIGCRDNVAELLDAATGELVARPMSHARAVPAVAASPDGKVLLSGSRDGTARFWDAASGFPLGPPLRHLGPVTHVCYSPKGDHIATGTDTGHVLLWDIPPPPTRKTLEELRAELAQTDG